MRFFFELKENAGSFDFMPARAKNHPFIIAQPCKMLIQKCLSVYLNIKKHLMRLTSDSSKNKKMKNLIFFLGISEAYQITDSDRCPAIRGKFQ